jgi:hypothetical protein
VPASFARVLLVAVTSISLAACNPASTGGPSDADEVNVGINNQLGNAISVVLQVGSKTFPSFTVPNGGFVTDEYSPASVGVAVKITVTSLGSVAAPAARTCIAKAPIIGTSEYGQVDIAPGGILCQDPNTWQ